MMFEQTWQVGNRLAILAARCYRALASGGWRKAAAQRRQFYEQTWAAAAERLGAQVVDLAPGLQQFMRGDEIVRAYCNQTELDDPITLAICGDKPLVYRLLSAQGLPVPAHCVCRLATFSIAREFLLKLGGPAVVKPARDTGGGAGITTGIKTAWALWRAVVWASTYGDDVLVEQQIPGDTLRLLYLDGELLDAVARRSPRVVGDGRSSVAQLIQQGNERRLAADGIRQGQTLLAIDLDTRETLAEQGLRLSSIPAAGDTVLVKRVANDNSADDNVAVTDQLCAAIRDSGARAAAAVSARLVGVDILTTDPSRPLSDTGGVILELNTTPGWYYHYYRQGAPAPVADIILHRSFVRRELLAGSRP